VLRAFDYLGDEGFEGGDGTADYCNIDFDAGPDRDIYTGD
jgi:hypothetical protein